MGFLLEGYCYGSLDDLAAQFVSTPVYPNGFEPDGSYNIQGNSSIQFGARRGQNFTFNPPSCDYAGPLPSLVGETSDYADLWAAGLLVLVAAYSVRMAKRALGGRG